MSGGTGGGGVAGRSQKRILGVFVSETLQRKEPSLQWLVLVTEEVVVMSRASDQFSFPQVMEPGGHVLEVSPHSRVRSRVRGRRA